MEVAMSTDERAIGQNVSMYPADWELVKAEAECKGLTTSAALRMILREWQSMREAQYRETIKQLEAVMHLMERERSDRAPSEPPANMDDGVDNK
jgi:hypothetical protein